MDFPPATTVQRYFYALGDAGLWLDINHLLLLACWEATGGEASPSAGDGVENPVRVRAREGHQGDSSRASNVAQGGAQGDPGARGRPCSVSS
jgi:hypothetical protein